jgi:cytochrome c
VAAAGFTLAGGPSASAADPAVAREPAAADPGHPDLPEAFEVCTSCHAYLPDDPPLEAPTLWQVVGRRIATVEGYEYSPALRKVGGFWDRATLDRFLAAPQAFAPGIRMTFGGVRNAADRVVVIDFLETLAPQSEDDEASGVPAN